MATGLLILAIGEGTKLVAHLTEHDKRYTCTVKLGAETVSLDADGAITSVMPVPTLTQAMVANACRELESRTMQVPPMVSAVRVDGERLYERARRGEVLEVAARAVRLHSLTILSIGTDEIELEVHCGKGFYVRSLARDLALLLGTVGHLSVLRRTHVGEDDVVNAVAGAVLERASREDQAARDMVLQHVVPLRLACRRLPRVTLNPAGVDHAKHGRVVAFEHVQGVAPSQDGVVVLLDADEQPIAVGRVLADTITVARGFVNA